MAPYHDERHPAGTPILPANLMVVDVLLRRLARACVRVRACVGGVSVCVCVCVLQCLNYLTLRSCLFLSLPYTHVCFAVCVTLLFAFQFTLQPCFCFEKSDLGRNSNHL